MHSTPVHPSAHCRAYDAATLATSATALCMAGRTKIHIRPKQAKCPADGATFAGTPPRCPTCGRIPEGRYQLDFWYKGHRYRPETTREDGQPLDSYESALREATDIASLIRRKRLDPAVFRVHAKSEYTLDTRFNSWLKKLERLAVAGKRAPGYVRLVKTYWRAHLEAYGKTNLRELSKARLRDIRDELLVKELPRKDPKGPVRRLAPKTVANVMGILHSVLVEAQDLAILVTVPAMPDDELDEPTFVMMDIDAQLAALGKVLDHDRPLFLSLAEVGQRPGEIRALRVMDFDRERPSFRIRQHYSGRQVVRGRKGRTAEHEIPISRELATLLEQMLQDRAATQLEPHPESPLFLTALGVPYDERYSKIWQRACKDAGVEYVEPYHAFKHTLGYRMRLQGASRADLQAWFGHRSGKSTDRYFRDDVRVLERIRTVALQARRPSPDQHLGSKTTGKG